MLKKYYEQVLSLIISCILTFVLYNYLSQIEINDLYKSKYQLALESLSHSWNDLLYPEHSKVKPNSDVILLAVDEDAINDIGRWPWSRDIINKITKELFKYKINTLTYDIIFSETENNKIDADFAKTISEHADKITLGTYSNFRTESLPYQDYCNTEAFKYTGGLSLSKINPFFSVDDESDTYEEYRFDKIFIPLFHVIDKNSESYYQRIYSVKSIADLNKFQQNALVFYKKQKVYDYCKKWLTQDDPYSYKENTQLKNIYSEVYNAKNDSELLIEIQKFIASASPNPIPQYDKWRQNTDVIQNAANYTASFLADPDNDGIVRNYPLIYRTGNKLGTSYIPSPAIQAYLASTGYQVLFKIKKQDSLKKIYSVQIHDINSDSDKALYTIPTDHEGRLLINYYGKQNIIPYVSAKELLSSSPEIEYTVRKTTQNGQFVIERIRADKSEFLQNKNIIFGATAIGIYDIRTTPTDIIYPGPEIHATVLSNLLSNWYLTYDKNESKRSTAIFFIFILLSSAVFLKLGIRSSFLSYLILSLSLLFVQRSNFTQGIMFHSAFLYFILLFISFFTATVYKYFFQSKKSKEIKMAFSKYVSKDVVEEILKNESAIELRGQKLFMSVYFSDIRDFTSFSEKMDPVELSELLNKYFTPMSSIITKHQGTIDKYIGDAIMAMFGAPINYKDHAIQACEAALDCINALRTLNQDFKVKNWPELKIGIGINTGYMNAGNIGSDTIQNYTVIGDSVNLASRLESLTKQYKVNIIISEYTYELVKDRLICRELDKVQVKGKLEPITIYELIDRK